MDDIITGIMVVLIFIGNSNCYEHRYDQSIFIFGDIKKYCDMRCGGSTHTLCTEHKKRKKCSDNFVIYDYNANTLLQEDILMGLNGLRHRIAEKMEVANMNQLRWDKELSLMARYFLEGCDPLAVNPCTNLGEPYPAQTETEPRYYHISGTVGYRKSQFYPYHFVPSVLRDWYFEKNISPRPKIEKSEYGDTYGILEGNNNFTRLANPRVSRVGCSVARYGDGFALLCYYFPYFQSPVKFRKGTPTSSCFDLFPLKGLLFPNLCTSKANANANQLRVTLKCYLFVLIFMWWVRGNTYGYRMFRLRV